MKGWRWREGEGGKKKKKKQKKGKTGCPHFHSILFSPLRFFSAPSPSCTSVLCPFAALPSHFFLADALGGN